jgi:hypothetical protein
MIQMQFPYLAVVLVGNAGERVENELVLVVEVALTSGTSLSVCPAAIP